MGAGAGSSCAPARQRKRVQAAGRSPRALLARGAPGSPGGTTGHSQGKLHPNWETEDEKRPLRTEREKADRSSTGVGSAATTSRGGARPPAGRRRRVLEVQAGENVQNWGPGKPAFQQRMETAYCQQALTAETTERHTSEESRKVRARRSVSKRKGAHVATSKRRWRPVLLTATPASGADTDPEEGQGRRNGPGLCAAPQGSEHRLRFR